MFSIFKREKDEYNYFTSFEEISSFILKAAVLLSLSLKEYQLPLMEEKVKEIREIENAADEKRKEMMAYLYRDFLPPIEREDIIRMAYALDRVLSNIVDIMIQMDMYQIKTMPADMIDLVEIIEKASHKLSDLSKELSNFKNPEKILLIIEEIIQLEKKTDTIYYQGIKNLHIAKMDSYKSYRYSKIYDIFEAGIDAFEDLANAVEAIILKNT